MMLVVTPCITFSVDEARRDDPARRIDAATCGPGQFPDCDDAVIRDAHVGANRRCAGAIHYHAVYDRAVHGSSWGVSRPLSAIRDEGSHDRRSVESANVPRARGPALLVA
jgi:hypothetical protein